MLATFKLNHKKAFNQMSLLHFRNFARNVGSTASNKSKSYVPHTPSEEFDIHRFKMENKHENFHAKQYYNRGRGRNMFKYDSQFPEFRDEYRSTFQEHESELFYKNEAIKRKEHNRREDDIVKVIHKANQIKKLRRREQIEQEKNVDKGEWWI